MCLLLPVGSEIRVLEGRFRNISLTLRNSGEVIAVMVLGVILLKVTLANLLFFRALLAILVVFEAVLWVE